MNNMTTITINEAEPLDYFSYQMVREGGRNSTGGTAVIENQLPIYQGTISGLKTAEIEYLILASDLQGMVADGKEMKLLGEVLPDYLQLLFVTKFPATDLQKVGVLLCGDLYANLKKRGGKGDVKPVWRNFNQNFGFVTGVAGNHDDFGSPSEFEAFKSESDIYFLDKEIQPIKGITIGGISGIIGRPTKHFRNEEKSHLKELKKLFRKEPDFILLHEGPNHLDPRLRGSDSMRDAMEASKGTSIICFGHNHWKPTLVKNRETQLVALDGKCVILKLINT